LKNSQISTENDDRIATLYTKRGKYEKVSEEEKKTWETDYILLKEENLKELYLISKIGKKGILESSYGTFYTIEEYKENMSSMSLYTMELFSKINENNIIY